MGVSTVEKTKQDKELFSGELENQVPERNQTQED